MRHHTATSLHWTYPSHSLGGGGGGGGAGDGGGRGGGGEGGDGASCACAAACGYTTPPHPTHSEAERACMMYHCHWVCYPIIMPPAVLPTGEQTLASTIPFTASHPLVTSTRLSVR